MFNNRLSDTNQAIWFVVSAHFCDLLPVAHFMSPLNVTPRRNLLQGSRHTQDSGQQTHRTVGGRHTGQWAAGTQDSGQQALSCCCSVAKSCWTLCEPTNCSRPGFPVLHCLPEFAQTRVRWADDATQPAGPLSPLVVLPLVFPASGSFPVSCSSHQVARVWSFSFSISPANEYSGLISWFDLLAVLGIFKCLLQHHSLRASILWCSAFLMVQFSHPYMTTGKTKALTIWTFVSKRMSLSTNSSKWSQTIGGDTFWGLITFVLGIF